ncbi:MAG: hypothetical protein EBQ82_07315 [Betaproteobacteria bacterium]|nr:hypothetical protein [Betaproteobacteria bacterium]NBY05185.1 hypothetical protein [Betaproteobacteria bacterium]
MNLPDSPPAWVPTLTEEIVLARAADQANAAVGLALGQHFPSELDEARLCMLVTDRLMAQLPDLIRASVREILLQQTPNGLENVHKPHDPPHTVV